MTQIKTQIHAIGPQNSQGLSEKKVKLIGATCVLALGGYLVADFVAPPKVVTQGVVTQATLSQGGSGSLYVEVTQGPYKDYAINVEVLAYEPKPKVGATIEFDLQKGYVTGQLRGSSPRLKR